MGKEGPQDAQPGPYLTRGQAQAVQFGDNALELQVRGAVGADLPVEDDLSRWFPVWGAPGL